MQITAMLHQYNKNLANGVEVSGGTQGMKQLVSSLQEMAVGNVFEGSINQMENGTVTLGLPDGRTIQARLDSGVSVRVGESMFFQVRSNNGAQISIRPFSNGLSANPTLLNALEAANLQPSDKMITMVNTMMEQSMSIDKQSLQQMAKLVMGNEGMDINSIVQMHKLGIPVTEELLAQFENYKSDQYAILDQLESVMEALPGELAGGGMEMDTLLEFNQQMVKIFLGEEQTAADGKVIAAEQTAESIIVSTEDAKQGGEISQPVQTEGAKNAEILQQAGGAAQTEGAKSAEILQQAEGAKNPEQLQQAEGAKNSEQLQQETGANQPETAAKTQPDQLRNLFNGNAWQHLSDQLGKIPQLAENPVLFQNGALSSDITSKELLQLLGQAFSSKDPFVRQVLGELVSSKEYRALIRNVMEQQWLVKPEELKTENKVKELYERLDRQLAQMEKVLKGFGQNASQLSDTASNVRSNIQFMNQLNQTFAYVQLPLKLAGQNAHSDLYVYTDKRKKQEKDGELTAFLHLDLDHLGSTDVSIKLQQKKVATNFYLSDDRSYQLILEHLDLLEQRLEEKGYQVKLQVTKQSEKANFVEDMFKQGTPSAGGMVHRYSFDVRA